MGRIAEEKKNYIMETARGAFIENGYAGVTMRQIYQKCGISKSGIYVYFSSIKDLFLAVLQRDAHSLRQAVDIEIWEGRPAEFILTDIMNVYREEMLGRKPSLARATYEFLMANPDERAFYRSQIDDLTSVIVTVIEYGMESGSFVVCDARAWASHIADVLFGMVLTVPLSGYSEDEVSNKLTFLIRPLLMDL
ncbi:MAG: TetR/AcrR family transcriptional regulator [Eubacteriaceae bacterium]|nr:TetR/AcrR family transcriptional regulator [Eubacteriaceae bacterium]